MLGAADCGGKSSPQRNPGVKKVVAKKRHPAHGHFNRINDYTMQSTNSSLACALLFPRHDTNREEYIREKTQGG